ncbi:hypothetical protein SMMN14_07437 [Sphaerulina musiva]
MRIPYAPSTPPATSPPSTSEIYSRIAARRAPRPLIPLDLALLHNPAIADGYNSLMGAIRTQSSFPLHLAELAICYIAVLNGAVYEWTAHSKIYLKADGGRREVLKALLELKGRSVDGNSSSSSGDDDGGLGAVLSEDEKDVLRFTEQSTKHVNVEEELVERLKGKFTHQQVMELMITVAGYNMVSRFLVGLDVTESNGKEMVMPPEEGM